MNTERYQAHLRKLLTEQYTVLRKAGVIPRDIARYLEGYLAAARALDAFSYAELDEMIETVHRQVLKQSREDRRNQAKKPPPLSDDFYDIPTWERQGKESLLR